MIKTLAPIEESHCQASPNATEAVNRAGIHRVINLQFLEKHGGKLVDNASHQSSSEGGTTFHASTACCDGDQACKDTIAQATDIVLLRDEIAKDKHGDSTCGSSQSRVHRHLCCQSTIVPGLHREGGSWVEAIPAEPKREGSQHHQGKVVRLKLLWVHEAALPWSQHNSTSKATDSTSEVDNATACGPATRSLYNEGPKGIL